MEWLGRMRVLPRRARYKSDEDDGDKAAAAPRVCLGDRGCGVDASSRHRDAGGGRRRSSARRTVTLQSAVTAWTGTFWHGLDACVLANAEPWRAWVVYRDVPRVTEMLQDKVVLRERG